MILNDKTIAQLVKKLSGKVSGKKKPMVIDDTTHRDDASTTANDIFKEMKKLPYAD